MDSIKKLPYRYWDSDEKEWEVPYDKLDYLKDLFKDHTMDIVDEVGITLDTQKTFDMEQISYEFKTKPFSHQLEGVKFGLTHDKWMLCDEQGCISGDATVQIKEHGKTRTRRTSLANLYKLFQKDKTIKIKSLVNGRFAYMPIKNVLDKGIQETIIIEVIGKVLKCTPDHLIYTDRGWVQANALKLDDKIAMSLKCYRDKVVFVEVDWIWHSPIKKQVYDVVIDDLEIHNFVANSIVVHNCGKTKTIIDIASYRKQLDNIEHCLIVCGVNGLKWNWKNEIGTHSNEGAHILGQREKKNRLVIGSNKDKLEDLLKIDELPYFIITNIESLRDDGIAKELTKLCKDKIGMIAVDELHVCRSSSSQQGRGLLKLKAPIMVGMTGTPIMNKPLDLYVPLKWLGYERYNFYTFRNYYCKMGGYGGYQVIGYQHLDELQAKLSDIMLRRLKEDVLDLPDKLFIDEYVEMDKEQTKIYKEVTSDIKSNIDMIKSSFNPLAQLIRLQQATGYPGILSSTITKSAKLDRMEELVDESLENNRKVVIFSCWAQIVEEAYKRLAKKHKVLKITGSVKDEDRHTQEYKFQNDDDYKIIIGTIGAMGTGINLYRGTVEIFLDEPWTAGNKDQAIDRCHRIGQNQNVTIYTLITKDTIDERIHQVVYDKRKMSNYIVDGIEDDKGALVDYLIS